MEIENEFINTTRRVLLQIARCIKQIQSRRLHCSHDYSFHRCAVDEDHLSEEILLRICHIHYFGHQWRTTPSKNLCGWRTRPNKKMRKSPLHKLEKHRGDRVWLDWPWVRFSQVWLWQWSLSCSFRVTHRTDSDLSPYIACLSYSDSHRKTSTTQMTTSSTSSTLTTSSSTTSVSTTSTSSSTSTTSSTSATSSTFTTTTTSVTTTTVTTTTSKTTTSKSSTDWERNEEQIRRWHFSMSKITSQRTERHRSWDDINPLFSISNDHDNSQWVVVRQMNSRIACVLSATTTTTAPLPSQCSSYTSMADSTRNTAYASSSVCDSSVFGTTGIWVRFQSPGGTTIPTSAPSYYSCGTDAPGWYNGPYPSSAGSTTTGTVCYYWSGATCNWSNQISTTNCNGYFVFLLIDPPVCNLRYCNI